VLDAWVDSFLAFKLVGISKRGNCKLLERLITCTQMDESRSLVGNPFKHTELLQIKYANDRRLLGYPSEIMLLLNK
jgi:hypothetical protein